MLAQVFSDVRKAMGGEPRNSTDPMTFSIENTGTLTFEPGKQEVLISLAVPLMPYDTDTMAKAFRAANKPDSNISPVWVGYYDKSLVLITSTSDHGVKAEQLLRAAEALISFWTEVTQV